MMLEQLRHGLLERLLEELGFIAGDTVPHLIFTEVEVVNGVGPVVFYVPAKTGEHHADVEPWVGHATNIGFDVMEHGGW